MDGLWEEHERLSNKHDLSKSLEDVHKTIEILITARKAICDCECDKLSRPRLPFSNLLLTSLAHAAPSSASITLAKLQNPVKQSFDGLGNDLKEVYKGLGSYLKVLDKGGFPKTSTQ